MIKLHCDIKSCEKDLTNKGHYCAPILDKQYNLCEECFEYLASFIQTRLHKGVDLQGPVVNEPFKVTLESLNEDPDRPAFGFYVREHQSEN